MSASTSAAPVEASRPDKRFHTAQARMALAGGTLVRSENDRGDAVFVVTRWNLTKTLPDLDSVEAFIDRMGGRAK